MSSTDAAVQRQSDRGESCMPIAEQPSRRPKWLRRILAVALSLAILALIVTFAAQYLRAELYYRRARAELERYRFAEARDLLDRCLAVRPRHNPARFLAAQTERRMGNLEMAEKHLEKCQNQTDISQDSIVMERMMIRAQDGDVDAVMPALRDLVQKGHPDSLLFLEALARGYAASYRFLDIDFVLHMWKERDPTSLLRLFFEGWVKEQLGPREEAVRSYREVTERDPDNDEARLRLANLLLERSQPQEAANQLEIIIRRQPDNFAAKTRLARSWHDLGRLDDARQLLDEVLELRPDYSAALTARGRLAMQENQPKPAEAWLRRAAELDRTDYQALFLLHESLQRQDRTAEAAEVHKRMKAMEADMRKIHEIITHRLSESPDDPDLHVEAGQIMLRAGDPREGLRWLNQALKIDPRYPPAHEALAKHFESIGDSRRAARHRQMASH